jgi:hypothetical protein
MALVATHRPPLEVNAARRGEQSPRGPRLWDPGTTNAGIYRLPATGCKRTAVHDPRSTTHARQTSPLPPSEAPQHPHTEPVFLLPEWNLFSYSQCKKLPFPVMGQQTLIVKCFVFNDITVVLFGRSSALESCKLNCLLPGRVPPIPTDRRTSARGSQLPGH